MLIVPLSGAAARSAKEQSDASGVMEIPLSSDEHRYVGPIPAFQPRSQSPGSAGLDPARSNLRDDSSHVLASPSDAESCWSHQLRSRPIQVAPSGNPEPDRCEPGEGAAQN